MARRSTGALRTGASQRTISAPSSATTRSSCCRASKGVEPRVGGSNGEAAVAHLAVLPGDRAPLARQLLGATQRQRQDRVGRVRGTCGRKDARPGDVEVGNLVGLAVAVGD